MLVDAPPHLPRLQVERAARQADFAALLEEAEDQPQECERARYAAEEIAQFIELEVGGVLVLLSGKSAHHQTPLVLGLSDSQRARCANHCLFL